MRQMVLGAIAAFALTVIVISFLTPKAAAPTPPDAGQQQATAVVGVAIVDAGLAPHLGTKAPITPIRRFNMPLNRLQIQERVPAARMQVHEIVTDGGT